MSNLNWSMNDSFTASPSTSQPKNDDKTSSQRVTSSAPPSTSSITQSGGIFATGGWPPQTPFSSWPVQLSTTSLAAPSQSTSSTLLSTSTWPITSLQSRASSSTAPAPCGTPSSIWSRNLPSNTPNLSAPSTSAFPTSLTPASGTDSADTALGDDIDLMYDMVIEDMKPLTPLESVKTFEELKLSEPLLKAVYSSKFAKPSRIQEYALPYLLRDPSEHLIAQSQSGTGKTAAFALAVLSRLNYLDESTQALVLAPTRELARQIVMVFKELGQYTDAKICEAIPEGGQQSAPMLKSHIVVGTPGTISNMLKRKKIVKDKVRILVLDEADHMLDLQGLGDQSNQIRKLLLPVIQVIMFSATWNDEVLKYAMKIMHGKFNRIHLQVRHLVLKSIKAFYLDCENEDDRFDMLVALYSLVSVSQSMIFVARRKTATKIGTMMSQKGHSVAYLHGAMESAERDDTIDSFRNAQTKVLISTNLLARGIDVSNVNLVINYDLPAKVDGTADLDAYIHRIGRTGRFGRIGVTVNFVHDETSYQLLEMIQIFYGQKLLKLPTGDSTEDFSVRLDRMENFIKSALKSSS
ncbi:RNA helicase required for poly(A+) mRNA export [Podila epicladia]|nr:RNA helicase required for poly(A+) mRNA export [Podila epicladia]